MTASAALRAIGDAVLDRRVRDHPFAALALGRPVSALPGLSAAKVGEAGSFARAMLERLAALDETALDEAERCFHGALRFDLENRAAEPGQHPLQFLVAPYLCGDQQRAAAAALASQPLGTSAEREAMIALARDYARMLREMAAHTREQAMRGVRLPRPAIAGARASIASMAAEARALAMPVAGRLAALDAAARAALEDALESVLAREILPALDDLAAVVDADYAARAPGAVGLGQYPGGTDAYRTLIRVRADSELEPGEIHRIGLMMIDELEAGKAALRARCWPGEDVAAIHARFLRDPRWRARAPEEVEACFLGHMRRIEPLLPAWFGTLPHAPWGVRRGDPVTEAGSSHGYYQMPTAADPTGWYRYNGSGLDERSLIGAAHLMYHELMPGHHLQLSLQRENPAVHPLATLLASAGYVEGWAVYASELAHEMGAYAPEDLYGHYLMQSFLAARLVVDTGLNALGWTLDRARAFLRAHCFESEALIERELLRYATDIPAQALAYALGRHRIEGLRAEAAQRAGGDFDVRAFHDALLRFGGLPLPVLAARMARVFDGRARIGPWVS